MLQFNNAEMLFNNAENKYALMNGMEKILLRWFHVAVWEGGYLRFEKYGSDHWTGKV